MDAVSRIEQALNSAFNRTEGPSCPPRLAAAMRSAVFPRGARIRPRICLAVAAACGEDDPAVSEAAAASIELLHCASLVHDDLPCFDDADTRRGRPTVHAAFGEPLAVLAGDGLIVLAFQNLTRAAHAPQRLGGLLTIIGQAVGAPNGNADELGKPVGRDIALGRPSATREFGIAGAVQRLELLVREGMESIPTCPGAAELRALIMLEASRLLPKGLARHAA
jgi:geranylgeranyl pyrophosphate synthase